METGTSYSHDLYVLFLPSWHHSMCRTGVHNLAGITLGFSTGVHHLVDITSGVQHRSPQPLELPSVEC